MNSKMETNINGEIDYVKEYNTAVEFLFELWKNKFIIDLNNSPDKDECIEEHSAFFKNIIFNRIVDENRGFAFLKFEEDKRLQFYTHLKHIRTNFNFSYNFLNRTQNGEKLNIFENDIIPEIYAGAVWQFYNWLKSGRISDTKSEPIIETNLSETEIVYLCYYNNEEITYSNSHLIAKKFGKKETTNLYVKYNSFVKNNLGSGTDTIKKDKNKIKRYKKIIPLINNEENKNRAEVVLKELEINHNKAIKDGTYTDQEEDHEVNN